MLIEFEPNYQKRVLAMRFSQPTVVATKKDVLSWRQQWMDALKSWHSPYSAIVDCTNLTIAGEDKALVQQELAVMARFFGGLFLKKMVAFGIDELRGRPCLPCEVFDEAQSASLAVGLREPVERAPAADFRSSIVLQNDFQRHVIEMSFSEPVRVETPAHFIALKSKLSNILMQWHSKWSLLIDCANLDFSAGMESEWASFDKYFRGFFMKTVIGYSPRPGCDSYPFPVFRARHKAVAQLENEGNIMGDLADCKSKKVP